MAYTFNRTCNFFFNRVFFVQAVQKIKEQLPASAVVIHSYFLSDNTLFLLYAFLRKIRTLNIVHKRFDIFFDIRRCREQRSPFRPNPLGLSSVQLEAIEHRPDVGPVLIVRGADLMDGTPIYDIKPYIPYADCHPDAAAGFTAQTQFHHLTMVCDAGLWARVPAVQQAALQGVLENDPRPSYQHDPERVYGMEFGGLEVHFKVDGEVLTVTGIDRR